MNARQIDDEEHRMLRSNEGHTASLSRLESPTKLLTSQTKRDGVLFSDDKWGIEASEEDNLSKLKGIRDASSIGDQSGGLNRTGKKKPTKPSKQKRVSDKAESSEKNRRAGDNGSKMSDNSTLRIYRNSSHSNVANVHNAQKSLKIDY